ncbi:MAG: hypothetical protein HY083_00375 [Gammaproteobacteria bacterium]|nr:hypothetical protein [Gammaproteobacteria bacterium]
MRNDSPIVHTQIRRSLRSVIPVLLAFIICIFFVGFVSAAEPKLYELLKRATSKAEIERIAKDLFRIEKQSEDKWLIYSNDEYQLRPAAIIEFQGSKLLKQIHYGSAAASSKNQDTIVFIESLYKLLEILKQKGNETAKVSLISFKIRGVERKIIELRFDDRIVSLDVWRDPGDLESVSMQAVRPEESFFH